MKFWTEKEKEFIRAHYLTMPYKRMANVLGVTYGQLVGKIHDLCLRKTKANTKAMSHLTPVASIIVAHQLHVDWSDISEEEMFRGYVAPTYDKLSDDEKEMFDEMKKNKKKL